MMPLNALAGLVLGIGMIGSLAYELWRVVARRGVSEYDTARRFMRDQVAFYVISTAFVAVLLLDWEFAALAGLGLVLFILAFSLVQYFPKTYPARRPGLVDNLEALWFIATVGAAGVLNIVQLAGLTLTP
jgi:hypothetical protein